MNRRLRPLALLALAAAAATACHDGTTAPSSRQASDLHFLRPALTAPPLRDTTVSFWAYTDATTDTALRYAPPPGSTESEDFLHFTVPAGALARRPDGTAFAAHDSVLITIRVVDFSRLIVQFEPSQLTFSSANPALLTISFVNADQDFNGDGIENAQDTTVESELALWRQEQPGQPWYRVAGTLHLDSEEADATIGGFTGYALAY